MSWIFVSPRTPQTLTDRRSLDLEFAKITRCGYAMDNEENDEGVRCVGAPVFDYRGAVIGATSISAPAMSFSEAHAVAVAPALMSAPLKFRKRWERPQTSGPFPS